VDLLDEARWEEEGRLKVRTGPSVFSRTGVVEIMVRSFYGLKIIRSGVVGS